MSEAVTRWRAALAAGAAYFGIVFAIGFVLGVARTLAIAPWAGPVGAVAIELPIILAAAWMVCLRVTRRFAVPAATGPRWAMGGVALGLLLVAEWALSLSLGGRSTAEHLALYAEPAHQLGLAGQLLFAIWPWVQGRRERRGP
jgi:hypothetical protein